MNVNAPIIMIRPILIVFVILPLVAAAQTAKTGASACVPCHLQAKTQPHTSMGQALETVEDCKVLIDRPVLTVTVGRYSYRIERSGNQSEYSVSDGVGRSRCQFAGRWGQVLPSGKPTSSKRVENCMRVASAISAS